MATLDIFNNDAFSVSRLTETIIDIPRVPTQLGDEGMFAQYGIDTLTMMLERKGDSINLVPTAPRGGVKQPVGLTGRKLIPIAAVHLPQGGTVMADEVQGVRAFGSETEVEQVQAKVREKLANMKANLDLTLEYQRVGALKGVVYDADGSTVLWDIYSIFGMTQVTHYFDIAAANSASDLKQKCINLKRAIRNKLGGRTFSGVGVRCSEGWFDKFTSHNNMKAAWDKWQDGRYLREDQSEADFVYAGVTFRIYSGGTSAGDFIEDGYGYAYPMGVPRMFHQAFAPANYMETVNTNGLPYYAKMERMKFDVGMEMESQSNPITFNSLPECVIKLSAAAAP